MSTVAELAWTQFWQTSVVALAAGVIAWAFCRRKPHLAYLVWMVVIAKCLTPPLWSSPTGAFSWAMKTRSATEPTRSPANNTALGARPVGPIAASAPAPITQHVALSDQINTDRTFAWPTATTTLGIIWLAGALAFATFMAWNLKRASRRLKRTALPLDPTLLDQSNDCARRLALRKRVRFVVTSAPVGPAAYGILRPVVVLPHSIVKQMPPSALAPIIAHELVHIRRGDSLVALIQVFAQCLWWFHPLVWWANRQANRERERACDEEVLANLTIDPADYGQCLLDILRMKQKLRPVLAFPGVRAVEVTARRLEHIMQPDSRFHSRTPRWCWAIAIFAALVALPGAGLAFHSTSEASGITQANDQPPRTVSSEIVISQNFFVIPIRTKLQQLLVANGKPVQALVEVNAYALLGKRGDDLLRALDAPTLERSLAAIKAREPNASVVFVTGHFREVSQEMVESKKDDAELESLYRSLAKDAKLRVDRVYVTADNSSRTRWRQTVAFLKGIDRAKETGTETGVGDRDVTAYPVQNKISQLLTASFSNSRFTVADCVLYVHKPLDANDHAMLGPDLEARAKQAVTQLKLPERRRIDYHLIPADHNRQAFLRNHDAIMTQFYPNEAPRLTKQLGFQDYAVTF